MVHPIVASNRYLTLATCVENIVWSAPVAYAYSEDKKEFYFYSSTKALHSLHIDENPLVSLCVFDSNKPSNKAEGIQVSAQAALVDEPELEIVLKLYYEQSFPNMDEREKWVRPKENFLGNAPHRFYKLLPIKAYINDVDENMIDYRKEIDIF